ncbi:MAG: hydroxyacid dehydrogenase [Clostridia bacterium]|nr:hydroxyacid dehydrogenase [Clostridia bacterium]
MKAIFLSEKKEKIFQVYAPETVQTLQRLLDVEKHGYTKADILREPSACSHTEIIFSTWGMPSFSEEEIRTYFPSLKAIFYAAGSVQKFARPFLACGVRIFSAWAANAVPVAEYTVSQILLANKGFYAHTRLMAERMVSDARALTARYPGNYGVRIGLVGCGMIGSLVAQMLKAYHLEVAVYDPYLSPERTKTLGVTLCSLEELFSTCGVVSNHLPNLDATKRMLRYEHFSSMVPYATFLNTGRGAQVVEAELVRILRERPDLTAVLDVTDPEPADLSHPFYTLPNCFLTPHIAGSLGNEVARMGEYMAEELVRYLEGSRTDYEVTLNMLETMA